MRLQIVVALICNKLLLKGCWALGNDRWSSRASKDQGKTVNDVPEHLFFQQQTIQ